MKLSSHGIETLNEVSLSPKPTEYKYDVKLEVGDLSGQGGVAIVSVFNDLVKKMKEVVDDDKPLVVLTATDKLYFDHKDMSSDEFKTAFKVDHGDGKTPKVLLGFKLRTMTKLYDIKQRLMKSFLIPHNLFLREHFGGFQNGLKTYTYGFLKRDHPDHHDVSTLNNRFSKALTGAWKNFEKADKTKWKEMIPEAFYADSVVIPMNFIKDRVAAECDGKARIVTSAILVSTPKKFGPILRELLDSTILNKKINNLIPFAYQREDAAGYYHLVADQDRFIDQHRNIPILEVPPDAPSHFGNQGKSLDHILNANSDIHRVAYDHKNRKYHVSTTAAKYKEVHTWIAHILKEHNFPYSPIVRPMKYGTAGTNTGKYSSIFADAVSVATASYDASTIKTSRSNAWKQRPPLNISYVPTDEAFPPLNPKPRVTPATPSTASETLDEDTIQSAITAAIKSVQEQHRVEIEELKHEMDKKMAQVELQMQELATKVATQTYQALVMEDSPLVTKKDHINIQNDMTIIHTQLSTLIQLFNKATGTTFSSAAVNPDVPTRTGKRTKQNRTPEKITPSTQDAPSTSATSDFDESMEGCEE